MKILVIVPTPFFVSRGTPIRILEEALALERRGHLITLVSYHIGENVTDIIQTRIDHRRIRRLLFWYKKLEAGADWQKILLDIMLFRKVFSLARKQKPDVLYGHLHEGTLIGWAVKKILFWRKMVLVADFHGGLTAEMVSHGYLQRGALRRAFQYIERWIDRLGDIVVTSSWENTENINSSFQMRKKAETLLDGADIFRYGKMAERLDIRKKWGIPAESFVFVYTGAFIANKGFFLMTEAIEKFLLLGEKKVFFVLAGFPSGHINRWAQEKTIQEQVKIISPFRYFDLPELLSVCDVGIDPKDSGVRQASGKMLQYMASELPVVCFDRENNRAYLDDGGIYCEEGSEGLLNGLFYCIGHSEEIIEKGRKNRARVEKFSWESGARKMEALIESELSKKRRRV